MCGSSGTPQRLVCEVVAIDQEQDPVEAAVLEQSIGLRHRRERLARTRRHLHQRPVALLIGQALLNPVDGLDLRRPQRISVQRGQLADLCAPGGVIRIRLGLTEVTGQCLGPRHIEDQPGTRIRIEPVGEMGFHAGGLKHERQSAVPCLRRNPDVGGQTVGVHRRLPLHAGERRANRFSLDDADDGLVDVQQVIDTTVPRFHHHLTDGDTLRRE